MEETKNCEARYCEAHPHPWNRIIDILLVLWAVTVTGYLCFADGNFTNEIFCKAILPGVISFFCSKLFLSVSRENKIVEAKTLRQKIKRIKTILTQNPTFGYRGTAPPVLQKIMDIVDA